MPTDWKRGLPRAAELFGGALRIRGRGRFRSESARCSPIDPDRLSLNAHAIKTGTESWRSRKTLERQRRKGGEAQDSVIARGPCHPALRSRLSVALRGWFFWEQPGLVQLRREWGQITSQVGPLLVDASENKRMAPQKLLGSFRFLLVFCGTASSIALVRRAVKGRGPASSASGPPAVRGLVRQRSGFHRTRVPSDLASSTAAETVSNLRHTVP